ncbi:MAG: magnesium/cobalt transporter CorA [Phycisphaeraceae bacterium]|nr:magnesium/cobalt transporter CorA [Phycisphaeraceae bacterium]
MRHSPQEERKHKHNHLGPAAVGLAARKLGRAINGTHLAKLFDKKKPGAIPGIDAEQLVAVEPTTDEAVELTCIDYGPGPQAARKVADVGALGELPTDEGFKVRWVNLSSVSNKKMIGLMARTYRLHPLAIEDMLHIPQRPKVEYFPGSAKYGEYLFIVANMNCLVDGHISSEQVSIFLGHNLVLTFQENVGDVWDPIRQRIATVGTRLRENDASFLVYALLDALVDHHFPILEHYGEWLEQIEAKVLDHPMPAAAREIHRVKRELLLLRRQIWPMREVVHRLRQEPFALISETTRTFLGDVYDHAVQVLEIVETYREMATGLTETNLTSMSNRMNEVMKVLTVFASIFIPITFLAGVYGMNFEHMPELHSRWGYGVFWLVCLSVAVGLLIWFKRRRWI